MSAPATWTAREVIDASRAASRAAVAAERERASLEDGFEAANPILPATDDSFDSGIEEHYRRVRQDVMGHLRDVYDFALWFDAYAVSLQDHANGVSTIPRSTGKGHTKTGIGAIIDAKHAAGEIGWKYSTVRAYRVLAGFEWSVIAKCGSLKKALTWCANEKRTPTEREERKERKATMRNKERGYLREIHVQGCQLDEQAKELRELRERVRILEADANPVQVQALEECVESHALAERMAYKKLDLSEALAHTYKSKLERQGRELGAARVALAARPPTNGNGNGADRDGSSLLLDIEKNRLVHVDPGEQA